MGIIFSKVIFSNSNLYCKLNILRTYNKQVLSQSSIMLSKVTMIANSAAEAHLHILLLVELPD